MKKPIAITIPKPCHEDWEEMTPVQQGKHCAVCDKNVVDFTSLSEDALYKRVTQDDQLCGRFRKDQLNTPINVSHNQSRSFIQAAAALLFPVALLSVTDVTSQTKKDVYTTAEIALVEHKLKTYDSLGISALSRKQKPLKPLHISGKVRGDNTLLPGTNVIVKGTKRGTQTDFDGNYSITVHPGETLVYSFVGFETREIVISSQKEITVNLSLDSVAMGELVVVGMIGTQDYKAYKRELRKEERKAIRQKKRNNKQ